jgi:hypothetical protein
MSQQHPLERRGYSAPQRLLVHWYKVHKTGSVGINVTFRCVSLASIIQHAMRMRFVMLSIVVCPALAYFSTLSHTRHDFLENVIEQKNVYFDSLYKTSVEIFLILGGTERDIINVQTSLRKVPVILVIF